MTAPDMHMHAELARMTDRVRALLAERDSLAHRLHEAEQKLDDVAVSGQEEDDASVARVLRTVRPTLTLVPPGRTLADGWRGRLNGDGA